MEKAESSTAAMVGTVELSWKEKLKGLITTLILEDESCEVQIVDETSRILESLKELKLKNLNEETDPDSDSFFLALTQQEIEGMIYLNSFLEKLSSPSLSDQKEAAKALRLLTKGNVPNLKAFGKIDGAVSELLEPLSELSKTTDEQLHEDISAVLFNVSILPENRRSVAKCSLTFPYLMQSLGFGNHDARISAAGTLFSLFQDENLKKIVGPVALKPLLNLFKEEPLAMIHAGKAIYTLSLVEENREELIKLGAVNVIVEEIKREDAGEVLSLLAQGLMQILTELAKSEHAAKQIGELDILPSVLKMLRGSISNNSDERVRSHSENCLSVLENVCLENWRLLIVLWAEEVANRTFSKLAHGSKQDDTARKILNKLKEISSLVAEVFKVISMAAAA